MVFDEFITRSVLSRELKRLLVQGKYSDKNDENRIRVWISKKLNLNSTAEPVRRPKEKKEVSKDMMVAIRAKDILKAEIKRGHTVDREIMKGIGIYKDGELEKREDKINKIFDDIYSEIVDEEIEREIRKKRKKNVVRVDEPWVCRDDSDGVFLLRPPRLPNKFLEELRRICSELRDRRHLPRFEDRSARDERKTQLFKKENEKDIVWFHYNNRITSLASVINFLQRVYSLEPDRFKIHVDFGLVLEIHNPDETEEGRKYDYEANPPQERNIDYLFF
jgi:hypothetical protein